MHSAALPLTLFSTCKPFIGEAAVMQRNAILSWAKLGLKILLFGNEKGVRDITEEVGAQHINQIATSESGTPLVNALFNQAKALTDTPFLAYINADIILQKDFVATLEKLLIKPVCDQPLLITARRKNIPLNTPLFDQPGSENDKQLQQLIAEYGCWDQSNAVDLFIFSRDLFNNIPPLVIGRMQWDNWLLWKATDDAATIIDATADITILHPIHGYANHTDGWQQVTQGEEAQSNRKYCQGQLLDLAQASTDLLVNGQLQPKTYHLDYLPDHKKLTAGTIQYLLSQFDQRPIAESLDCIRGLLWSNQLYFPLHDTGEQYQKEKIKQLLTKANTAIINNDLKKSLSILQEVMVADLIKKLENNSHRPLLIWGCGQLGQRLQALLENKNISHLGFLDSNLALANSYMNGKPIISDSWHDGVSPQGDRPFIIIASMYYQEISATLIASGLSPKQDFLT